MNDNEAKLMIMSGEYKGASISLRPFEEVTLGRDPSVSKLVFSSPHISRQHCQLQYNPNLKKVRIKNLSSTGVVINGVNRLEYGESQYLNNGDSIALGKTENILSVTIPQYQGVQGDTDTLIQQNLHPLYVPGNNRYMPDSSDVSANALSSHSSANKQKKPVLSIIGLSLGGIAFLISVIFILCAMEATSFEYGCYMFYLNNAITVHMTMILAFAGLVINIIGIAVDKKKNMAIAGLLCSIACGVLVLTLISFAVNYTPTLEDTIENWEQWLN